MSPSIHKPIRKKINQARTRWRRGAGLTGTLIFLTILFSILLLTFGLDRLLYLTTPIRYLFWFLFMLTALSAIPLTIRPFIVRRTDEWTARRLEIHNPGLENRLINCLQFIKENSLPEPHIQTLVQSACAQLEASPQSLGFPPKRASRLLIVSSILAVLLAVNGLLDPQRSWNTLLRVCFPWSNITPFYETRILVTPGDARIPEGDSLPITIQFQGKKPDHAAITTSFNEKDWMEEQLEVPFGSEQIQYRFDSVTRPFFYSVRAGDGRSAIYHVTVAPRPVIVDLSLEFQYPSYTSLPTERALASDGVVSVWKGTRVIVSATSDVPIETGRVNHRAGKDVSIVQAKITNERCLTAQFTVQENGMYTIKMYTAENVDNANPVRYPITAIPDAPPRIALPLPGRNIPETRVPSNIPCLARATDDLGLARVELFCFNTTKESTQTIATQTGGPLKKSIEMESILKINEQEYAPGETLELFARATDTFGQSAESERYTLTLIEETESTEETRLPAKELADAMDEMREALEKHDPEKENEETKETILDTIDDILKKQKEIIPPTKDLLEIPEEQRLIEEKDELERLAQAEDRLLDEIKDFNKFLKDHAPWKFDDPSLVDEFNTIVDNVERAEESLIGNAVEIALDSEEAALWSLEKVEERIESELESWLPDKPDRVKWNLEDAPEDIIDELSVVDLPEELEDLIGELIEDEEDVNEETEDLSSNWASADIEEGWDVMDGQISNFSAKGKTGNTLPDSTEATGRSGEGRTGKSNGEFVEKYAEYKDDRQTPARMRDEPFENSTVMELDNKTPSQSTGGGKRSGMGPEGFTGRPPLTLQNKLNRLAEQQADIRQRAEKLDNQLNNLYLAPKELKSSVEAMKEIEQDLKEFRLTKVLEKQRQSIKDLRTIQKAITDPLSSFAERKKQQRQKDTQAVETIQEEQFPPQYAEALNLYFRSLAEE